MKCWLLLAGLVGIGSAHAEPAGGPPELRVGTDVETSYWNHRPSVHRIWFAAQGDQRLDPDAFYTRVGRPDLADEYDRRHEIMVGSLAVGGVAMAASFVAFFAMRPTLDDGACATSACEDAAQTRFHDAQHDEILVSFGLGGLSAVALGIAGWYHFHPHPISESEARQLAARYNQRLQLTPVATSTISGLALTGRF